MRKSIKNNFMPCTFIENGPFSGDRLISFTDYYGNKIKVLERAINIVDNCVKVEILKEDKDKCLIKLWNFMDSKQAYVKKWW